MNKKSKKATGKKGEPEREKPGVESMRKNRLLVTKLVHKLKLTMYYILKHVLHADYYVLIYWTCDVLLLSVWINSTQRCLNSASPSTTFPTWQCGSTRSRRGSTSPRTSRSDSPSKHAHNLKNSFCRWSCTDLNLINTAPLFASELHGVHHYSNLQTSVSSEEVRL